MICEKCKNFIKKEDLTKINNKDCTGYCCYLKMELLGKPDDCTDFKKKWDMEVKQ